VTRKTPDEEKKRKILERARAQFLTRGVSSLTMGEIASLQGISKKTLYRFFPNKEELVTAAVEEKISELGAQIAAIAARREVAFPVRLREILQIVTRQLGAIGDNLIRDLYYHEPQLWERIDGFRRDYVFAVVTRLLEEGGKSGYIRGDIDGRLVPVLFVNAFSAVLNPAQFVRLPFPPSELFDAFIRILFGGILTEKAQRQLFSQEGKK
jgi:AcrR family transcriptional regulator